VVAVVMVCCLQKASAALSVSHAVACQSEVDPKVRTDLMSV
jgi:hypothetical protein